MTTLPSRHALILFAHGARDARWAEPLTRIQQMVKNQVDPSMQIHLAFLELMSPSLPELTAKLISEQINKITVVPIFLGQGGHVRRDLPALLNQLSTEYSTVQFHLAEAIGENELVLDAIASVCVACLK